MPHLSKSQLRQRCKLQRNQLSYPEVSVISEQIYHNIQSMHAFQESKYLALYAAMEQEVDLTSVWQKACQQGKKCYFPKIMPDRTLVFLPAKQETTWVRNLFGILEPDASLDHALSPEQFDIIFIPLVAFDLKGVRLGMGQGYYDRTLAVKRPALLLGVAYEFQRQKNLPYEPWDVPLDAVVTQENVYRLNSSHR